MKLNIGNTPLVEIDAINGAKVFAKLEQFNPGGSIKDRVALTMIEEAENRGELHYGTNIFENSSGNTAIGLAMIARYKGYQIHAICDQNVPPGKLSRITALGGNIIYPPSTPVGFDGAQLRDSLADYLANKIPNSITTSQFSNPDNSLAHAQGTGPEIWKQTHGKVSQVVAAAGTCGTLMGVGRFLKSKKRNIKMRAVEPLGSVIFGGTSGEFLIQGGGLSYTPKLLDKTLIDTNSKISDADAIKAIYRFAHETGLLVGGTAGLVLHDLYRLAETARVDEVIVGILPDGGDRYTDTIYSPDWLNQHGFQLPEKEKPDVSVAQSIKDLGCTYNFLKNESFKDETFKDIVGLYKTMGDDIPENLTNLINQ